MRVRDLRALRVRCFCRSRSDGLSRKLRAPKRIPLRHRLRLRCLQLSRRLNRWCETPHWSSQLVPCAPYNSKTHRETEGRDKTERARKIKHQAAQLERERTRQTERERETYGEGECEKPGRTSGLGGWSQWLGARISCVVSGGSLRFREFRRTQGLRVILVLCSGTGKLSSNCVDHWVLGLPLSSLDLAMQRKMREGSTVGSG